MYLCALFTYIIPNVIFKPRWIRSRIQGDGVFGRLRILGNSKLLET